MSRGDDALLIPILLPLSPAASRSNRTCEIGPQKGYSIGSRVSPEAGERDEEADTVSLYGSNRSAQAGITMMRITALAAAVLCLAGCFVFDNPWDTTNPPPTVQFQIVVTGGTYSGTYIWSSADNTYTAVLHGTPYHVYMDLEGYWILSYLYNWDHYSGGIYGISPAHAALPPTNGAYWTPGGTLASIDDSAGGICRTLVSPDSPAMVGNTLQVTFKASDPQNLSTCQWERSSSREFLSSVLVGTGSTYLLTTPDKYQWIRVTITPTDRTGVIIGSPASSPPVYVYN